MITTVCANWYGDEVWQCCLITKFETLTGHKVIFFVRLVPAKFINYSRFSFQTKTNGHMRPGI